MRTSRLIPYVLAMATTLAAPVYAQHNHPPLHVDASLEECSVIFAPTLSQTAFRRFTREFGSVSAFKQMGPSSTLGRGNMLVAIEMMSFTVDEWSDAWNDTFAHPNDHHPLGARQEFPKVKLQYGATDRLDVGAFYTENPLANYGWIGVDGKYRVLGEDAQRPFNLAVRAAYTKTLYVDDMDMHALTADVSMDRMLWQKVRPYVGLGADAVYARETSDVVDLRTERNVIPHAFAGVDVTIWQRMKLGAEFTVGARPSAHVQVGGVVF